MASFYLSPFIGTGTTEDEFRPDIDAASWQIIDLRADETSVTGWCVVRADGVTRVGSNVEYLGESTDLGSVLPRPAQNKLKNNLNVDIQQTTLDAILAELLIVWGENGPGRTRWRPLKANRQGRHRIVMGGEVIYDAPVIQGSTVTESFNTTDSDTLGPDLTWTEVAGDFDVKSNKGHMPGAQGGFPLFARAESDVSTDDHYTQAEIDFENGNTGFCGLAVRFSSSAETCYWAVLGRYTDQQRIYKTVTGSDTQLTSESTSVVGAGPYTCYFEVDGSALEMDFEFTTLSTTDTSITGNTRGGIVGHGRSDAARTASWDSFTVSDLGGTNATATPAVIVTTVAAPAATPAADSTVEPAVTATTVALPAATPSADSTVSPATITATVATPQATPSADSAVSPAVIATTVALPAATPDTAANATVTPAVIATTVATPQATPQTGATVEPAAIATTVALPTATPQTAGNATVTPAVITTTIATPQATPSADSTVEPAVVVTSIAVPTVTINTQTIVSPSPIAAVVALPAPSITADSTVTPNVIPLTVAIPTVSGVGQIVPTARWREHATTSTRKAGATVATRKEGKAT